MIHGRGSVPSGRERSSEVLYEVKDFSRQDEVAEALGPEGRLAKRAGTESRGSGGHLSPAGRLPSVVLEVPVSFLGGAEGPTGRVATEYVPDLGSWTL